MSAILPSNLPAAAMPDRIAVTSVEDLFRPLPGDAHPASGVCRVITHLVIHEINRVAEGANLPLVDDVDEDRYLPAIAPLLNRAKRDWRQDSPRPCASELKAVRASIREFDRWKRKPTAEELSEAVYKALGIERPTPVAGGDAEARKVVSAPPMPKPEPVKQGQPSWLREFAVAVGDNELAQKTFIRPLLNMSEPAARAAIAKIAEGTQKGKENGRIDRIVEQASKQRKVERQDYVTGCLRSVKSILHEMAQQDWQASEQEGQEARL